MYIDLKSKQTLPMTDKNIKREVVEIPLTSLDLPQCRVPPRPRPRFLTLLSCMRVL